ncbi:hypothetical protein [Paulownia witches'-broom phytoplasma]|uniref:hypothetical protein n=1 Tax=Paulownia witches'-broom phytoplasma TaxID=39647 RepID=UPI001CED0F40|nr:hypothetical protein [Paulownia witches'-broom phytoplasma]GLH60868.1 hypothetical protein PAWBP_6060 [Paulownia witches'-broom phytoplasma]
MYEGMKFNAIKLRGFLERQYYDMTSKEQTLFGKIKTLQERKEKIQKNIDEIDQKLKEIETELDLYKVLEKKYLEMHNRLITYEKENSFSFR